MALFDRLARRQFLVVTGKGGVGKTVVSALLGRLLASAGRRVLLLEVDPRANLHELAGTAPSAGDVVSIAPDLFLQNLQPRQVMEQIVRDHLRLEMLVKRVVASPIFQHFADAAPGLKELAVLGHAYRLLHGHGPEARLGVDLVILDAPATGHGISMLAAPLVVSDVIAGGPFGHMAGELSRFIADRQRSGIVTVTLAEEMPVQEALELRDALETRIGRVPDLLVVNGLYPPVADPGGREVSATLELLQRRRALNERELARLAASWRGPIVRLPLLPVHRGPGLVDALAPRLADALAREAAA
jgi:anion-transporting  ArsA/GET3 family ATPase